MSLGKLILQTTVSMFINIKTMKSTLYPLIYRFPDLCKMSSRSLTVVLVVIALILAVVSLILSIVSLNGRGIIEISSNSASYSGINPFIFKNTPSDRFTRQSYDLLSSILLNWPESPAATFMIMHIFQRIREQTFFKSDKYRLQLTKLGWNEMNGDEGKYLWT